MGKGFATRIVSIYDTETTNVNVKNNWYAFPVTFQVNTLRSSIEEYVPGKSDDIEIFRNVSDMVAYVMRVIDLGLHNGYVPIVCGYNLLFDMQPIMSALVDAIVEKYGFIDVDPCAQSSSNVYYIDFYGSDDSDATPLVRFWDTFHLEMGGLAAMGDTAGLEKLKGDWDYSLCRAPQTAITDEERGYASRDVQVIPAYLRYLIEANPWLTSTMLGTRVLTKTSLVRRMAENEIGKLSFIGDNGKKQQVGKLFMAACLRDLPKCYYDYALRKACFRGGFTFTSARWASVVVKNVASLDVVSMHHTFINGRYVPEGFAPVNKTVLQQMCEEIVSTPLDYVLDHYHKPFRNAINARIAFNNIRLKKGTPFEAEGIALAPRSKFGVMTRDMTEYQKSQAAQESERASRESGWRDRAVGAEFAFGKLYSAERVVMHLTEVELYAMSLVYEWDSMEVILGEGTLKWTRPPLYIVLQSHLLFKRKQDMKYINKKYREGVPYTEPIPDTIPKGIADGLREGRLTQGFVASYYQSTVKGMFNAIYGTQAQDLYKPSYSFDVRAGIEVNRMTVASPDNFKQPKRPKVMYNYGSRIVAGSRLHLVIAIILLYKELGGRVHVTGGDTDSLKVSCDEDVTDEDLVRALAPIADASKKAIDKASQRARELFPEQASDLEGVGSFDVEDCIDSKRYAYHMEAWNKSRISCDEQGHTHITCAGLPRPEHTYNYEKLSYDMLQNATPYEIFPLILGYNVFIYSNVSHTLQRTNPDFDDRFEGDVTDYTGHTHHVDVPQSVALYPCGRWLGQTSAPSNAENVAFLRRHYDREVDVRERFVGVRNVRVDDGKIYGEPFVEF